MVNAAINTDPRYTLFQKLVNSIKTKQPLAPLQMTEVDIRQYIDAKWFEYEKEKLFTNVPLIVGFSSMLQKPGEHFTFDEAGMPMLIVRDKAGKLRCFLNVCRHRGVRLANSQEISKAKTFSCPYHHWTYDLEGKLIFVPSEEAFPDLDKSCRSLRELPIEEAHGFIWVNPTLDSRIDLPSFLGNIAVDLEKFDFAGSYFFKQSTRICNANWKLIIEAFQDGYHVTRLHNRSVGGFFLDNQSVQEREQQHLRSIVARKEIGEILDSPPESWNFRFHSSFSHYIFPNTITIMHPDYTSHLSLFPLAVDKTFVLHNCVVEREPKSEKELKHFERGFKIIDEGVFSNEDLFVCEQAQMGIKSRANVTHLVGGYEQGIRTFHEVLRDTLGPFKPS